MLPVGRALVADFQKQVQLIKARHIDNANELALACVPTVAVHLLPKVFAEFTRRRPKARLHVFDKTTTEIGDMVAAGLAEFGVTLLGANRCNHVQHPLLVEEFVVVYPTAHRLSGRKVIQWKDLEDSPLVRFTMPNINRIVMDNALGKTSDRLNWVYEVQHTMTALMLVQSGLALAAIPRLAAQDLPEGLKAAKLSSPKITRTVGIMRRRGAATSDLAGVFQNSLKAHAAELTTPPSKERKSS
jgi:DNA-binding transcriptional LysR family regulator